MQAYGKPPMEVGNVYYNKGTKYLLNNRFQKALDTLKKEPFDTKEKFLNMGNAARGLGKFDVALGYYERTLDDTVVSMEGSYGLYAPGLCNIGLLLYGDGQDAEAIRFYKAALELNPKTYDAIWNCSTALLRDWCSGGTMNNDAWSMYDYRFKVLGRLTDKYPNWGGQRVKRLVVLAEQGLGDKLMWGRYFSLLSEKVDKVILQLPSIMHSLFPEYECVESLEDVVADASIPLAKLAERFGVIEGDYLAGRYPRVRTDDGLRVAVEWAGSTTHKNNGYRSCFPVYFEKLAAKFPNVKFYNYRPDAPKIKGVEKVKCTNLEDTCRGLAEVDLLITVDTSIVHLAGCMGLETWMIQPLRETDFRWGLTESKRKYGLMKDEENIWYESVSVIDNPAWDKTFPMIEARLRSYIEEKQVASFREALMEVMDETI